METKINKARQFLEKGNKVQFTVIATKRSNRTIEDLSNEILGLMAGESKINQEPIRKGSKVIFTIERK